MTRPMPRLGSIALLLCVAAKARDPPGRTLACWRLRSLPLAADAAPDTTKIEEVRAPSARRTSELDLDAALGISWGGASRCDAADPTCVTDGGTGDPPRRSPCPNQRAGSAASRRCVLVSRATTRGCCGCIPQPRLPQQTPPLLAQGAYKDTTESTPAGVR